jgi:hypothetical protein
MGDALATGTPLNLPFLHGKPGPTFSSVWRKSAPEGERAPTAVTSRHRLAPVMRPRLIPATLSDAASSAPRSSEAPQAACCRPHIVPSARRFSPTGREIDRLVIRWPAQRCQWRFIEQSSVSPGKTPEFPEPVAKGDRRNRRGRGIS